MENPQRQQEELTPDLARSSPDIFKRKLLDTLRATTQWSGKVWRTLEEQGVVSRNSLSLRPDTWVSNTRETSEPDGRKTRLIELGIAPIPSELAAKILFLYERFEGNAGLTYRFSHEIHHAVASGAASSPTPAFANLHNIAHDIRAKSPESGLSALGSLPFYKEKGVVTQTTEDVVEMLNMFSIGEQYFQNYLDFLANPTQESLRTNAHLSHIDTPTRNTLEQSVREVISSLLNQNR